MHYDRIGACPCGRPGCARPLLALLLRWGYCTMFPALYKEGIGCDYAAQFYPVRRNYRYETGVGTAEILVPTPAFRTSSCLWSLAAVPVGQLLVGVGNAQHSGLLERFARDLQADGQTWT